MYQRLPNNSNYQPYTEMSALSHFRMDPAADPGFPAGGCRPIGRPTSDVGAFGRKHMQKRKNGVHWGRRRRPFDPPLGPTQKVKLHYL